LPFGRGITLPQQKWRRRLWRRHIADYPLVYSRLIGCPRGRNGLFFLADSSNDRLEASQLVCGRFLLPKDCVALLYQTPDRGFSRAQQWCDDLKLRHQTKFPSTAARRA
jgi:hypothetical protein